MNKKEMKEQILEQVFDANFVRKLKHVQADIASYKEEKQYLKDRGGKRKYRKAFKVINRRLRELALERQGYLSEGSGIRGDPAPSPEVLEQLKHGDEHYVYNGGSKPKTGSGDKNRIMNERSAKKAKKIQLTG